jgi:hypothetical protein
MHLDILYVYIHIKNYISRNTRTDLQFEMDGVLVIEDLASGAAMLADETNNSQPI